MVKAITSFLITALLALSALFPLATASADGTNLFANPSLEAPASILMPANWQNNKWGTNTAKFTYEASGRTGNRSATVAVSNYKSGDAKWKPLAVNVTPGVTYTFSDWYKSTATSGIDVVLTTTSGAVSYIWKGDYAASPTWKQAAFTYKAPANAKTLTIHHYLRTNGTLTIDDYSLTAPLTTPIPTTPTVELSSPANNTTVNGVIAVSATAGGGSPITGVQFKLNGANLGAADTTAPYSINWDTATVANGTHTLTATATNAAGLTATASSMITVNNPTAPVVAITAPVNNATVSGTHTVTASATSNSAVTGVQFKLDGANLGSPDTTAPYSIDWNTAATANGTHTLSAVATNAAGQSTAAPAVMVTVNNTVTPPAAPTNLLPNPSVETNTDGWAIGNWGTNTATNTYEPTGHNSNRSLKTAITAYTNGDAKWFFAPVTVTPGTTYNYSSWYKSDVTTDLNAMVTFNDGSVQYYYLTTASASPNDWAKVSTQFVAPANAKSISIFQVLYKVGYLQTDDFSFGPFQPAKFGRALVSLTFDDGWRSIYDNGLPLLNKYGFVSTQYLLTETITYPDYMTIAMMQAFKDQGSEIAGHTISHADLTTLTLPQLTNELTTSQNQLRSWYGASAAKNFASPYGAYNNTTLNEIKKYYRSHRSTDVGYNTKDTFNIYNIKVQNLLYTTTAAEVAGWVAQAQATNTWLVLVYHEVGTTNEDPTYSVTPAALDAQLNVIKQSGIAVVTVDQALDEILPQLP